MIIRKFDGLVRATMVHFLSGPCRLIIVNEFPKSGGTWLGQMLSQALSAPFPRNEIPRVIPCILHGHYKRRWGMKNVILMWRDVRDVMVSWYFHSLFGNEKEASSFVTNNRRRVPFRDPENAQKNMAAFLRYCFETQKHPGFTWTEFVHIWYGRPGTIQVKYEDLKAHGELELQRICREIGRELSPDKAEKIVSTLSFAAQAGRGAGDARVGSFLRKGIVGDWKNYFNRDASEILNEYAGAELNLLGYESDDNWVQTTPIEIVS